MMTRIHGGKKMPLRKEIAATSVDAKAERVRARFATPGKHVIYDKKLQEAVKYIDAVDSGQVPSNLKKFPYLRKEVGLTAPTPLELAQLWVGMNEAWEAIAPLIEEVSLRAKYAIKSAKSQAEIDEIVLVGLDELDAIGEPTPMQIQRNL